MSDTKRARILGYAALSLFALLAAVMILQLRLPGDRALSLFIAQTRSDALVGAATFINAFGGTTGIGIGLLLVSVSWWRRDFSTAFAIVIGTLILAFGIELIKLAIARPRPAYAVFTESNFAFPSSHAAVSAYFYGWLWVLGRRAENVWIRRITIIGLPLLVATIGFGRVYVSAHWPSDVVGGFLLGLGLLLVVVSSSTLRHISGTTSKN